MNTTFSRTCLLSLVVALAACGGSDPESTSEDGSKEELLSAKTCTSLKNMCGKGNATACNLATKHCPTVPATPPAVPGDTCENAIVVDLKDLSPTNPIEFTLNPTGAKYNYPSSNGNVNQAKYPDLIVKVINAPGGQHLTRLDGSGIMAFMLPSWLTDVCPVSTGNSCGGSTDHEGLMDIPDCHGGSYPSDATRVGTFHRMFWFQSAEPSTFLFTMEEPPTPAVATGDTCESAVVVDLKDLSPTNPIKFTLNPAGAKRDYPSSNGNVNQANYPDLIVKVINAPGGQKLTRLDGSGIMAFMIANQLTDVCPVSTGNSCGGSTDHDGLMGIPGCVHKSDDPPGFFPSEANRVGTFYRMFWFQSTDPVPFEFTL